MSGNGASGAGGDGVAASDLEGTDLRESDFKAAGRTVLVTGGSGGIGSAICDGFLAQGCEVVSLSLEPPAQPHPGLRHETVDLTDAAALSALVQRLAAERQILTLVHNAGAIREAALEEVSLADLEALTAIHINAAVLLVQALLPGMKAARHGRIVLVGSRAALGLPKRTAYAATKAGMLGLMRSWALELGPFGITCNLVAPGPIAGTELFHAVIPRDDPRLARIAETIPVRRLGRPEDVARAVLFLAAPESDFITGQNLFVCGGASVGSMAL